MTWQQFVMQVESALDSSSVDVDAQPIDIDWIDVSKSEKLIVTVDTSAMPLRCSVQIITSTF